MTETLSQSQKRTRSEFERQLHRLEQDSLRMGALVENSFLLAHAALFERDLESATRIDAQDRQIDQIYRQIETDCIELITLQSPVARDIRLLSAVMQLIRDIERIGDYAENLGEIAIKLFPYPPSPYLGELEVMSNRCRAMLAMSLEALANLDENIGLQIKAKDDAVDYDYQHIYNLLAHQKCFGEQTEPVMLMVLAIHHLERMADHATNVGLRVAYIVTGKLG
ncbi:MULTISPECIES: phosphate signaling complex protein PhoU [Pseudanabaena]|uniref:Phosphate-specific transport system accessory protein PhoU n=2 Tax=Pseudanabaena TaxID=1152 RepID=L8N478_9CYAN|nr:MULTISPECIES: phosphate signaling complex protein PhoU [Pseudanabaena]ELS33894.1 phosphate uptake regulator, PhoU [Pseudanabaena biceps PCC 7429]MDG3493920.1 phosphate signaling complex protein PhoU [Pseudanabaena catenata USMAC16]TYQ24452.1 phosphate signaling complex protein PhoU [Pseudanabaena sp. UWO310]